MSWKALKETKSLRQTHISPQSLSQSSPIGWMVSGFSWCWLVVDSWLLVAFWIQLVCCLDNCPVVLTQSEGCDGSDVFVVLCSAALHQKKQSQPVRCLSQCHLRVHWCSEPPSLNLCWPHSHHFLQLLFHKTDKNVVAERIILFWSFNRKQQPAAHCS